MSQPSNSSTSLLDPPLIPPESPGSSVSTRLEEEYDELLKYAVVVPNYDPSQAPGILADGRKQRDFARAVEDRIITVTATNARQTPSPCGSKEMGDMSDSEQRTPRGGAVSSGVRQLPDFGQSPISSKDRSRSPGTGDRSRQEDAYDADRKASMQPMFPQSFKRGPYCAPEPVDKVRVEKVYKATVDPDVAQMETMMDQWCLELKRNILAEYAQAKMTIVLNHQEIMQKETERFASEKAEYVKEMDTMKELLHTYEQTMERKDAVITNLTTALHRSRDKLELMRKFCDWKAQHNDAKREAFASNLARKHYERTLNRRVLSAWFSTIHRKWREHVEKACQAKAQQVCLQLTTDYEAKIASLNEVLDASRLEIQRLQLERERYEEAMKKAFMRGVCALNMEAMNMFHDEGDTDGRPLSNRSAEDANFSNNAENGVAHKPGVAGKAIPLDPVFASGADDLPAKVVTSQGSRSSQPHSQPRQSSAKSSSASSVPSSKQPRVVNAKVSSKTAEAARPSGRSVSPGLHPPMASVVVERHQPVTKQTIGHATATKFARTAGEGEKYRRLAGQQGVPGKITPQAHSVHVVD